MGRRGPPPTPTKFRLLRDNPGKRAMNTREPTPRRSAPRCPEWLEGEARVAWRWLITELKAMQLLTSADAHAMAAYCETYARWRAAETFLKKHGEAYPIRDDAGKMKFMQPFPQVAISRNLVQVLKTYQQEFGLTPASRTRIQVPWNWEETEEDRTARRILGY